jgi:hypothetical protein
VARYGHGRGSSDKPLPDPTTTYAVAGSSTENVEARDPQICAQWAEIQAMLTPGARTQQPLAEAADRIQVLVRERDHGGFGALALPDDPSSEVLFRRDRFRGQCNTWPTSCAGPLASRCAMPSPRKTSYATRLAEPSLLTDPKSASRSARCVGQRRADPSGPQVARCGRPLPARSPIHNAEARDRQLCVEPSGCCEPAHCQPHDRHCQDDGIGGSVEVVQAEEDADRDGTCHRDDGKDRMAKGGRSERVVPLNRSGRRPPRSRDEREERDAENGTIDGRGQSHSDDDEWEKRDHCQPCSSAVPLFVSHRAKPARSERGSADMRTARRFGCVVQ